MKDENKKKKVNKMEKSKKRKRAQEEPAKEKGNKWQEFLRRHSPTTEEKS